MFDTPILLLAFNRPDTLSKLIDTLKLIKPTNLFVAVDGPRKGRFDDEVNILKVQDIINNINWKCNLKKLYREENMGCGVSPANAISWFFNNVEMGIILEDDCIPDETFFGYCETMLKRYKDNERIMHIAGNNPLGNTAWGPGSYYYSKYPLVWGWATWRRAWEKYDFNISDYLIFKSEKKIKQKVRRVEEQNYWLLHFDEVYGGKRKDIWDFQWAFTLINNDGIAITPNINLISNIGFGENATHTTNTSAKVAFLKTGKVEELISPNKIEINHKADTKLFNELWTSRTTFINQCRNLSYKILPKWILEYYWKIKKG